MNESASGPRALVVMPTYNEAINITKIIPAVLQQSPLIDMMIVDDNSPDGTANLVKEMQNLHPGRIFILHHPHKMGVTKAYIDGFRYGLEKGYAYMFEMDADFSHSPDALPRFLEAAQDADLVLGSRYVQGISVVRWPMQRLLLSYGGSIYTRLITGIPIMDPTGGFKCFSRKVLEAIDLSSIHSNGYAFQIEMNFRAWKKGFKIKEIPIVFTERAEGVSKMSSKIVREAIWMVWKLKLQSLFGRL